MPQAVAVAAVTAAAQLGGSALASRSANKAGKMQQDAADKALAFEKEREAYKRQQFETQQAAAQRQWEARERVRLALLKRYGINVPGGMGRPGDARASATLEPIPTAPRRGPVDLADMAPIPNAGPIGSGPEIDHFGKPSRMGLTLADLANWSPNVWKQR